MDTRIRELTLEAAKECTNREDLFAAALDKIFFSKLSKVINDDFEEELSIYINDAFDYLPKE